MKQWLASEEWLKDGFTFELESAVDARAMFEAIPEDWLERGAKERKKATELRSLLRVLESQTEVVPVEVVTRERPDFELRTGQGLVGVELSTLTTTRGERASSTLASRGEGYVEEEGYREPGERPSGRGFVGREPEELWIEHATLCLVNKLQRLRGYDKRLGRSWLILYDNAHFSMHVSFKDVEGEAAEKLPVVNSCFRRGFERLFFVSESQLLNLKLSCNLNGGANS
ncbi:MAG: hypothetical protein DWQ36_23215 [Acidobacteria bacterium]|nr:MAG: hypothetical protein DWQ30_19495 [Acidobacteriota bacterium]REK00325.1 MAG: hypothetical protein DWQ36_23215 [Acidobacteriota bacterium]